MALHLKYRPTSWNEVVGNKNVVSSLKDKVHRKDRAHTYLLHGEKGVGKTSLARIFGKELNLDVIEENVSGNNGVDFARELEKQSRFKGFKGDTLYILDEAHRLTKDAQNILLKILEEPPEHIYFILCTTEIKDFLPTLLSRCIKYELKAPSRADISKLLLTVCDKEGLSIKEEVINKICSATSNNPRDSLTLLDSVFGLQPDQIMDTIRGYSVSKSDTITLCRLLLNNDSWDKIRTVLCGIDDNTEGVKRVVCGYMSKVLLNGSNDRAFNILNMFDDLNFNSSKATVIKMCYFLSKTDKRR